MPDARLARARKSLPSDYVYEPPKAHGAVFVPFVQLVDAKHVTGVVTVTASRAVFYHPADASLEDEGYGHAV